MSDEFIDCSRECWIREDKIGELRRPAAGLCFGSRFLGQSDRKKYLRFLRETLPFSDFHKIRNRHSLWLAWLIDLCALHSDSRQLVFRVERKGMLTGFFVDHGFMFGGPHGPSHPHRTTAVRARYWDRRIYLIPDRTNLGHYEIDIPPKDFMRALSKVDGDRLRRLVGKKIPKEWFNEETNMIFEQCLEKFSQPKFLENAYDNMICSLEDYREQINPAPKWERAEKPPVGRIGEGTAVCL